MFRRLPLFLKRPIDANSHVDPDDVVVVKRSLERLGYYGCPKWGLHGFTDNGLFEGIKEFQRNHHLKVDGIMKPGGAKTRRPCGIGSLVLQNRMQIVTDSFRSTMQFVITYIRPREGAYMLYVWRLRMLAMRLVLESVRRLYQGLQSFRSMRRMEASLRNASAVRLRFSQSLANRRQRLSQAMVRSTIQRLGSATNPLMRSERLTISVLR